MWLKAYENTTDFEAKYLHPENLGEGGFGSVYAGIRKTDNLPQKIFLKKQKGHSNNAAISKPAEVPVEDGTMKDSKSKAIPATETPSNKQRSGDNITDTNTGEPTKVSVEHVKETENKKEDVAEQLPAPESTGTTVTEGGCDLSQSSSGPSTSKQEKRSTTIYFKTSRAEFEAKYLQLEKLGEGGFGSVYAGIRKTDNLPVAIKHIAKRYVTCQPVVLHGKIYNIPMEVLLMLRAAGGPRSVGKSSAVTLVDWYDLNQETLLVMERPAPSVDLLTYMLNNNGPMDENTVKNIMKQLVDAAIVMHSKGVFHRDIKSENILIETGSDVPRVRIIDFGCGCTVKNEPYRGFSGTSAYAPPEYFTRGAYEAAPTTVWQLGALLYELLDGYNQFITSEFLHKNITFNTGLSQDCQDLLNMCLALNPKERATLEQMQQHPWFS
ncbi:serine/threonine-protein kinase pim-2 [Lates calcarifer]|uniref:non-specific serine/threonine protein kinase n=2 Tax=Lates calcarifer TaxID=8187 RepID=A0AAJ7Q8G1_LATCA|nr:serine/threonine-protein kinase pim-2 [Lates calcarifer]